MILQGNNQDLQNLILKKEHKQLIKKFQDATFLEFVIGHHEGKETIILRDKINSIKVNIPYEDVRKTNRYRSNLRTKKEYRETKKKLEK